MEGRKGSMKDRKWREVKGHWRGVKGVYGRGERNVLREMNRIQKMLSNEWTRG